MNLPIKEAAKITGIGEQTLKKLTFKKNFPVIKCGCKKLIIMSKIEEWLYENRENI